VRSSCECGAQPSAAATGHSVLRHRRRRPVAVVAARAGVRCTRTGAPSAPWPASAWPEASFGAAEAARKMRLFFRLAARPESRFGFRLSAFGKGRRLSPDKGGFRFSVFRKRRTALLVLSVRLKSRSRLFGQPRCAAAPPPPPPPSRPLALHDGRGRCPARLRGRRSHGIVAVWDGGCRGRGACCRRAAPASLRLRLKSVILRDRMS